MCVCSRHSYRIAQFKTSICSNKTVTIFQSTFQQPTVSYNNLSKLMINYSLSYVEMPFNLTIRNIRLICILRIFVAFVFTCSTSLSYSSSDFNLFDLLDSIFKCLMWRSMESINDKILQRVKVSTKISGSDNDFGK